jgi:hypothetical protein
MHVSLNGTEDLPPEQDTRIYHFAGTQHDPGEQQPTQLPLDGSTGRYRYNWVDYTPLLRAVLVNLDHWVSDSVEPPPNVHPHLDDGTLKPRGEILKHLAGRPVPNLHIPVEERLQRLWQVDLGNDGDSGIVRFPVKVTGSYPPFVAALDDDGNELGGLRLPDLTRPLATHTGWNPRHPESGAPEQILDYKGATHLFARTEPDRNVADDPRASIAERYQNRDAYLRLVRNDAEELARQGYLLEEDIETVLADAAARYDLAAGAVESGPSDC